MEINQKTNRLAAQFEIRNDLRLVDGVDLITCLQLDDYHIVYEKVDTISSVNNLSIVFYRKQKLLLNCKALLTQFVGQTGFICTFE